MGDVSCCEPVQQILRQTTYREDIIAHLFNLRQGMDDVSCWVIIYLISRSGFTERGKEYESDVHRHRVINCQGVRCW